MLKFLFWVFILVFVAPVVLPLLLAAGVMFLVLLPILLICLGVKAVVALALLPFKLLCLC
jgi:hypothetical protein